MARQRYGKLHVFAGSFPSRDDACLHSEAQWEPEPDDSVSDEEYSAWEDRNPAWELRSDLGTGLDSDFIETIDGEKLSAWIPNQPGRLPDSIRCFAAGEVVSLSGVCWLLPSQGRVSMHGIECAYERCTSCSLFTIPQRPTKIFGAKRARFP